jgi:hypothetical protein
VEREAREENTRIAKSSFSSHNKRNKSPSGEICKDGDNTLESSSLGTLTIQIMTSTLRRFKRDLKRLKTRTEEF